MIYPKFPQRYLAAIVFCLILTLAALGGIFLIYLFNGSSTPLLFTADTNPAVAKPPNYFYGNDDKFSSYQQNLLHKESQLQESHSIKDELVTLDELASATSGSISSEQQLPRSMKQQQKQRVANRRENYHRMISAASGPVVANSDELSLEHQQAMFSQQQKLQHQPQLLQPSSDIADSVEATAKEVSAENDDDVKLVSALTSIEGFQYQIPSSSSENSDTIYIDDFERQSSSGDIRFDETSGSDDVPSDNTNNDNNNNNMQINNFTDVVVEENETNSAMTTASSATIMVAQNSSNIHRFNYKAHNKQRNNKRRQQLTALVKKKRKQQRLLSKLQHKSSSNNVVKLNSDKHLKHQLLQYSTQKVKKHLNLQHRENRFSAYDSNSSVNDVDDMIVNSGSGDFNSDDNNDNDDSDDDYDIDPDTTNYIKRINIKMWRSMSNVADNSNTQRKSKQRQQQLRQIQAFNNKKKKHRRYKHKQAQSADNNIFNKQQNLRDVPNDVDNFYSISSEIVSNLSAPQLNHEQETLAPTVTTSQQDKDFTVRKSNISSSSGSNNNRINQISTATTRNTVAIANNNQWLFSPTYSVNNVTSSTSMQVNNTSTPQHQQQQQLSSRMTDSAAAAAASEPVVKSADSGGSAAWLETRTRRIMGNVKKSEERSRQLLLCEEAGGGELCRMLFKGHLNE